MIAFFCNSLQSRSDAFYLCSIVAGDDWEDNPPGQCDMHLATLAVGLALSSTKACVGALYLSQEEWVQLAEFAVVLDKAVRLYFFSQEDRVVIAGEMALVLATLMADHKFDPKYLVVKTGSLIPWVASTTYQDLPRAERRATSNVPVVAS